MSQHTDHFGLQFSNSVLISVYFVDSLCIIHYKIMHWEGVARLYSDCLRRESNFLASTHRVTALCVCVCCIVCVCDCIMVISKPTHTHKAAVTGRVEAKKLLSRRRQSNYRHSFLLAPTKQIKSPASQIFPPAGIQISPNPPFFSLSLSVSLSFFFSFSLSFTSQNLKNWGSKC